MSNKGSLIILSAPSGSGKTSLAARIVPALENLEFSVSHTTRNRRQGECHGEQYFFVSPREFESMIEADAFLEWANVYGNYYGTSRRFVEKKLDEGYDVLLDIDIQGAKKVRAEIPEAVMIFVLPPSYAVLESRLRGRGLDDAAVIENRLRTARSEIQCFRDYDYVIINQDLDRSVVELKAIVTAARCRVPQRVAAAEAIVRTFSQD